MKRTGLSERSRQRTPEFEESSLKLDSAAEQQLAILPLATRVQTRIARGLPLFDPAAAARKI
jgi:hypothetical protein